MDTRLLWLALGGFAGTLESFVLGSLLPGIAADTGVTIGQAGLLVFCYALAHAIGTPILSALFGHVDRRKLLAGAELTFAGCALLLALAPEFGLLLAARIALALGAGLYTATAYATAVAISPPERRGRAMGTVVAGQSLAVLIGVPLGAFVAANFGWRTVYFIVAALGCSAAITLAFRLPSGLLGDRKTIRERVSALLIPGVPMALLGTLLFMVSGYIPMVYVAPLAMHSAYLGQDMLPLILLANGIGAFAGSNLGGQLSDRLRPHRAVLLATAAQMLVLLVLAAIPYFPEGMRPAGFLLVMGIIGFVGWAFWPAQSRLVADFAPSSAPLIIALNMTALNIGVALSAVIGGAAVDGAGAGSVPLISIPFAVAALAVVMAQPRFRARRDQTPARGPA